MNNVVYDKTPEFTGRNVPIEEIAAGVGKSAAFLREGIKRGVLKFGFAIQSTGKTSYSFYCPDKLVWEQLGYFNPNPEVKF